MKFRIVAPLVGAWIEILETKTISIPWIVAPLVGAWIEILDVLATYKEQICRSSCRSVD